MIEPSFLNTTLLKPAVSRRERQFQAVFDISVVIPTYNRCESLNRVFDGLASQHDVDLKRVEIIIIDDGSSDNTGKIVKQHAHQGKITTRYFFQQNRGPAAARNTGIRNAKGEVILFLGDDTLASPDLLRQHIEFHKIQCPELHTAILGFCPMVADPGFKSTLVQSWLNRKQMAFQNITHMEVISHQYFYTCNLSLKREFLLKNGLFDERYLFAAGEDIELGSRLTDAGMTLYYSKSALAYHVHPMSLFDYTKRYFKLGRSTAIKNKIAGRSGSSLKGSRDKLSPLRIKNPVKFVIFFILYLISLAAAISGFIYEKFKRSGLSRK